MIQKIRTAKLPGNCLYSALKLPKEKPCPNRTRLSLSLHIIRYFCVGTPPDLGQTVHTDVQSVGCLDAALAMDIHRQHRRLFVSWQANQPDGLLCPLGGHAG